MFTRTIIAFAVAAVITPTAAIAKPSQITLTAPYSSVVYQGECSGFGSICVRSGGSDPQSGVVHDAGFKQGAVTPDEETAAWVVSERGVQGKTQIGPLIAARPPTVTVTLKVDSARATFAGADHFSRSFAEFRLVSSVRHSACDCSLSVGAGGEPSQVIVATYGEQRAMLEQETFILQFPLQGFPSRHLPAGILTISAYVRGYGYIGPHGVGAVEGSLSATVERIVINQK